MDYPDIYAEAYVVTVSTFGVQMTLMQTRATDEAGTATEGTEIIGRVRMSKEMCEHLASTLTRASAAKAPGKVEGPTH